MCYNSVMETWIVDGFAVLFIVFIAASVLRGYFIKKRYTAELARHFDLEIQKYAFAGKTKLTGHIIDHPLTINQVIKGRNYKKRRIETVVELEINTQSDVNFLLETWKIETLADKKTQYPRHLTGDNDFDSKFTVSGYPESCLEYIFNSETRSMIQNIKTPKYAFFKGNNPFNSYTITGTGKSLEFRRVDNYLNTEYYKQVINTLLHIARLMETF